MIVYLDLLTPYLPTYISPIFAFGLACGVVGFVAALLGVWFILHTKGEEKPRRTTWEFLGDQFLETLETLAIFGFHALVVYAIIECSEFLDNLHKHDGHTPLSFGFRAVLFGVEVAEAILVPGVLLFGTIFALRTFIRRRWE